MGNRLDFCTNGFAVGTHSLSAFELTTGVYSMNLPMDVVNMPVLMKDINIQMTSSRVSERI